jgi:hypothetical protein
VPGFHRSSLVRLRRASRRSPVAVLPSTCPHHTSDAQNNARSFCRKTAPIPKKLAFSTTFPSNSRNPQPNHTPWSHDRGPPFDKLRVTVRALRQAQGDSEGKPCRLPRSVDRPHRPKPCDDARATIVPGWAAEDGAAEGRCGVAKRRMRESDGAPSDQSAGCAPGASPPQHHPPPHTPPQSQKDDATKPPKFPCAALISTRTDLRASSLICISHYGVELLLVLSLVVVRLASSVVRSSTAGLLVARRRRITVGALLS